MWMKEKFQKFHFAKQIEGIYKIEIMQKGSLAPFHLIQLLKRCKNLPAVHHGN